MSGLAPSMAAARAVVRRDLRLALSYRVRFFTQLLGGFFTLTLFFYISRLVRVSAFDSPDAYYAFAVAGLLTLQLLISTLQTPSTSLRQDLVAGTFERMIVSPFGPVGATLAMMVFPFLYSLVVALGMLLFAGLVFGVDVQWGTVALVPVVAIGAGLAFGGFGVLLLALMLVGKQAVAGTTFVVAGISLVSGLYFPVGLLPDWIRWTSEIQPFTPAVDLLRWALIGRPLQDPAWLDVGRLAFFALVLLPLSARLLTAAIRRGQRRGTITEY